MTTTRLVAIACVLLLGIGLLAFGRRAETGPSGEIIRLEGRIDELRAELEGERKAWRELARSLDAMAARLDAPVAPAPPVRSEPRRVGNEPEVAGRRAPRPPESARDRRIDPANLVEAGFSRTEVDAYMAHIDDLALRGLELRDRATREGWIDSPRYRQERRRLQAEQEGTRELFGDELYDWALFSSGRPNRVRVEGVIGGSAADGVGFEVGDIVQRYDDAPVLDYAELRARTASGREGDLTPVDILRKGEELRLYVPRGPLGVQLRPVSVKPAPVR